MVEYWKDETDQREFAEGNDGIKERWNLTPYNLFIYAN